MKCKKFNPIETLLYFLKAKNVPCIIRKTCQCNIYPLIPHFYIVELGNAGVCILLIFYLKQRLCVLVRTASQRQI